ncbi:hypothetical protein NECAME_03790 [Necator americanus]|uniref:RRM domain-containing protein n=1 Tax=Necator americanus TaxID=51031 RepID=W2T0I8_NECAM|nr:hypothetical protein NECAME_03790 [Necator americanus]ETN75408.1 hypothetical protein NECAME_03790 [Necator americanus]
MPCGMNVDHSGQPTWECMSTRSFTTVLKYAQTSLSLPFGNAHGGQHGSPSKRFTHSVSLAPPAESKSPLSGRRVLGTPSRPVSQFLSNEVEVFARKVFVGGLPIDVTEDEIWQTFSVFGNVLVDWPRRPDGTSARDEESGRGCE